MKTESMADISILSTNVNQLMFAAINVCIFAKQTSLLLLMFTDSCHAGCVDVLLMFANLLKLRNLRTFVARVDLQ